MNVLPPDHMLTSQPRPNFFIAGQPKSGSTALYETLRQHPQIYMPEMKEPDFFAADLRSRFPPLVDGDKPSTLQEYLELFRAAEPGQALGEASVTYLRSYVAATAIAEFNPASRIIVVLREPAQLLRSLHLQLIQAQIETVRDLRTALALEDARRRGRGIPRSSPRPQLLLYSENVRYVDQLKRFHARFPREQVLVLLYDDWVEDHDAVVRRIFQFLDVRDAVEVEHLTANPSVQLRSVWAERFLLRLSLGRGAGFGAANRSIKAVSSQRMRRSLLKLGDRFLQAPPPRVDEELMDEIRRQFAPEVESLSRYLERDLVSLWSGES